MSVNKKIREIAVISGKGGTGKTSVSGSLAFTTQNKIMVDCDVDAADLHLILKAQTGISKEFIGGQKAEIIEAACTDCGICTDFCRFDAVKERSEAVYGANTNKYIDEIACEGCGVCTEFCPENAIKMKDHLSGHWFVSQTRYGPLVHAKLGIAEANSGKLVSVLRKAARDMASKNRMDLILIDGSPGIGCPVISSLTGIDYALIVSEPTVSALHDMQRLIELTEHFGIKAGICINKYNINPRLCDEIEKFVTPKNIKVLSRIPYDTDFIKAQIKGVPYAEYKADGAKLMAELWENINEDINTNTNNSFSEKRKLVQLDNINKEH